MFKLKFLMTYIFRYLKFSSLADVRFCFVEKGSHKEPYFGIFYGNNEDGCLEKNYTSYIYIESVKERVISIKRTSDS